MISWSKFDGAGFGFLGSRSRTKRKNGSAQCRRVSSRALILFSLSVLFWSGSLAARADLQFDVFLGYDGIVPEATWFPIVFEIKNDGPSFTGTVELTTGNQSQTRRLKVELPTGTLKRVVLPVFSTTRS